MGLVEDAKKLTEKMTGWRRPRKREIASLVRPRKARTIALKDDGLVPNHPHWSLVAYRSPVRLIDALDPAAIFEDLFERNGW